MVRYRRIECERKSRNAGARRPRRCRSPSMRSPIHRGDRGLQSASEANGAPEHSLALSRSTKLATKRRDKVWRRSVKRLSVKRLSVETKCGDEVQVRSTHLNHALKPTLKRHTPPAYSIFLSTRPFAAPFSLFAFFAVKKTPSIRAHSRPLAVPFPRASVPL